MPDDQQQPEIKPVVKFGLGQIGNPTPAWATWVFRIVLYTAFVVTIICNFVSEIPQEIKNIAFRYSAEAIALVHALSKLFGVHYEYDDSRFNNDYTKKD